MIIYADGGSRGNPGPAGIGVVLIKDGQTVAEISKFLGVTTNNVAEYTALVLGLEKAIEMGAQNVEVRMDSELVVRQMKHEYRVKHEGLKPLFLKAETLSKKFATFKIVHVRREMNEHADRLANIAMDAGPSS
jgi:ribonuclease HI